MLYFHPSIPGKRAKPASWKVEGQRLGARIREIRIARRCVTYPEMRARMQRRLQPWQYINRDRLRWIEKTGGASALEVKVLAEALDCPINTFYEQPYGEIQVPPIANS